MRKLEAKDFEDLIKRLNPFGFKDENGESMTFENYGECYLHALKVLKEQYPRGFIDMPLFIHDNMKVPLKTAAIFARRFKFKNMPGEVYGIPWGGENENPRYQAECFMRNLHSLSETEFSQGYFNDAWERFLNELKIEN